MATTRNGKVADPGVLSATAAARYLGVSRTTLYRLLRVGDIPYVQISPGRKVFRPEDLKAYRDARLVSVEEAS